MPWLSWRMRWYISLMPQVTIIDRYGRFTMPKKLRASLSLTPGTKLTLTIRNGSILIAKSPEITAPKP